MRKPETAGEKLWRYRGVLLVVSIPLLLVITVVALVPRSSPLHYEKPHTIKELRQKGGSGAPATGTRYAVVFDAGSTGSRVHVFRFESSKKGTLKLISDTFEQLKPGLSSFSDDPEKAAQSLKPLLETAMKTVPQNLQASTPVSLKATAGLRLLPGGKADAILTAVEAHLKTYPFQLKEGAVSIMDGKDEGAFAWLTLNYLLGKLDSGDVTQTIAAIDLGGGSVQEAFALTDAAAAKAPKEYLAKLRSSGKALNVYVHSYLGYGLMAGRAKVLEAHAAGTPHACVPSGSASKYAYAGKDYTFVAEKVASFSGCETDAVTALDLAKPCSAPQTECSFSGGWRGTDLSKGRAYYVSSYFWDRALDTGIISDKNAISWPTTPEEFGKRAKEACSKDVAGVQAQYKGVQGEPAAQFLCLDLTFCYSLLTKGYKLATDAPITLVKQVKYNGQNIEAAWPLGAALNDLSP